jgi:transposase-like protein
MVARRQFSAEFKAQMVLEVVSGAKTAAEICREHRLKPDLLSKWKSQFLSEAPKVFQSLEQIDPAQARIADLERLVGRLTLELEAAKKASRHLRSVASRSEP